VGLLLDRRVILVEIKARERRQIGHLSSSSNAEIGVEAGEAMAISLLR
jgi:hypothetical protein